MTTATTLVNEPFKGLLATDEMMPYVLMCMEAADDIAVDTETSGLNVRNNIDYLMGICIDCPGVSTYIPLRHRESNVNKARWVPHIVKALEHKPLIWHNRKFDYHSFKTLGVDPLLFKGPSYDTLLLATLDNEEVWSKELDYLAKRYLGEEKHLKAEIDKIGEIYGRANVPAELYQNYGAWDAVLTRRLRDFLWPRIVKQELTSVYWDTESPFNNLLYEIEQRGVGVNPDLASEKARIGRGRMATLQRELGFNPASPIALGDVLLTKLGLPILVHTDSCEKCQRGYPVENHEWRASFNKVAMEEYDTLLEVSDNPLAKQITEYRGWQKAVTSLYEPLLVKVGPDGRVRTEFHQHRAVTGRLSSSNPNLQQIPRSTSKPWNGNAKSCFTAGLGSDWALYGWDYSQIELRLAAAYGDEKLLLTEFNENEQADPFSVLAPLVFGSLTPETRYWTKNRFVYPSIYGAGFNKICLTLGMSPEEARPLYDNYQAAIPGITYAAKQVSRVIEQRGYVKYWDGRRRHIRNKTKSYKGFNAVCQGGSAQLMKKAMLRCQSFENPDECFMVLTVHDEIVFCIRRELIEKYEPLVREAMTDWPLFGVKLTIEGKEWK